MKKIILFAFFLTLLVPSLFAAPAAVTPSLSSALDQNRIGIVAAIRGTVKIETAAKVGREVKSGTPVFLGDTVSTDGKGNLQIMLLDQTIFTIGPNSAIVIDKFIYDSSNQSGQVNAKVVKGVFRFVTGKIGQKNPDSMKVDLPAGTIGIRGTIVAGQSQGQRSTVVLLGPGERNNTSSRKGSITVGNTVNGSVKSVLINRSGFGTTIDGSGGQPSPPFKVPAEMMQVITSALGSTSEADSGDSDSDSAESGNGENSESSDSATEQAGQDTAGASDSVFDSTVNAEVFSDLDTVTSSASQNSVEDQITIFDGLTTFNDLVRITAGQFKFEQSGVPLNNTVNTTSQIGTYHILFNIDFGARTVGGPSSTIDGSINSHAFSFAIPSFTFGNGNAFALYSLSNSNTTPNQAHINLNASIFLLNQNGEPGSGMLHVVEISDNTSTGGPYPTGQGAGVTDRQSV